MIDSYIRHSPSSLNLFAAEPALFVLEKILGQKQIMGATVHRGSAVEDGVAIGLKFPDASLKECCEVAYRKYDALMALSTDERRDRYRDTIPEMVKQARAILKTYGPPSATQTLLEWKPDGLRLPIIGFLDFAWDDRSLIVDLKTTDKMPSTIKISHARQVGFYARSGNMSAEICYVTPKKCELHVLENIIEHREALFQLARKVENFLALSDDPAFFVSITAPDLDSFYWNEPRMRQIAFEVWKV